MKVLFSALHFAALRNFESVICGLAERGHDVLLLADEPESVGGQGLATSLEARYPGRVRCAFTPSYASEPWFAIARKLRQGTDYLRFSAPRYASFPKLRERAAERVPRALTTLMRTPGLNTASGRRLITALLDRLDREMPTNPTMDAFLAAERPDVLLLASITNPRGPQLDHLRSAQKLGVATAVCVYSWDHLSSKARVRIAPDRVLLWNDVQRQEAIELHGLPSNRIVVTGAQCYDQWFDKPPSRNRGEFARDMGLPSERSLLLYVCSALTPDPKESRFVRAWLESIRASPNPRLAGAAIIIRPHPERRDEWRDIDWSDLGPVRIGGHNPVTQTAKSDYHDALVHSVAVIGLVTSAFLEAAIVGRPVLALLPDELRSHQEGMQHFRYLLEVEDGLLETSRTLDQHVAQLDRIVAGDESYKARQTRFLRAFVRPFGLDQPGTPRFVDAVEAVGAERPVPVTHASSRLWNAAAARLVGACTVEGSAAHRWMMDAREWAEYGQRHRKLEVQRARDRERRQQRTAARDARQREKVDARAAEAAEKQDSRLEKERRKRAKTRENRWRRRTAKLAAAAQRVRNVFGASRHA